MREYEMRRNEPSQQLARFAQAMYKPAAENYGNIVKFKFPGKAIATTPNAGTRS